MKRIAAGVLTAAIASLGVQVVGAPVARADTPGCVSKKELNRVGDTDYSMRRIHRIFDTRGRLESKGKEWRSRTYKGCRKHTSAGVTFERRDGAWRWWAHWSYGL